MRKIALFWLLAIFIMAPLSSGEKPIVLLSQEGIEWVKGCTERHSEILWLADSQVRMTEEGQAKEGSYSEQLFGKKYVEFDRTLMTLRCLKLILDGSDAAYGAFTEAQPQELKLTRESFSQLNQEGQNLLKSHWHGLSEQEMAEAMVAALVLGDIGKSAKARTLFEPYKVSAIDHDDFYGEAIVVLKKNPLLCPTFAALKPEAKDLLVKVANLAHYGHIYHLEGGVNMFTKLKESRLAAEDPLALRFDLFVHTCDVAGALGHVNGHSSLSYNEKTHKAMRAMEEAILTFADTARSEKDVYLCYLSLRAGWLGFKSHEIEDRILTRTGAMMRLFSAQDGEVLKKALSALDSKMQKQIVEQLDRKQEEGTLRTPTYMPTVLLNLMNNTQLGSTHEERLTQAVQLGLPFIARVLEKHQEMILNHQIDPAVPLNFNVVAGIAKTSPHLLTQAFSIDAEGVVHLLKNT